jgi:hypothetical protein
MTVFIDPGERLYGNKIVLIFKCQPNVQPALGYPNLSYLRLHGDPARAIIPERIRLVHQEN